MKDTPPTSLSQLIVYCLVTVALCPWLTFADLSQTITTNTVARLYSKSGEVLVRRGTDGQWTPVEVNAAFTANDAIRVSKLGRAGILFDNGYFMRLTNNATVLFNSFSSSDPKPLKINSGTAHFYSRGESVSSDIATPIVSAAIRGTEFVIAISPDQQETRITVMDGSVEAYNDKGRTLLREGEAALTETGKAPVKQIVVSPQDAAQWTLSVPAEVDLNLLFDDPTAIREAVNTKNFAPARANFTGQTASDHLARAVLTAKGGDITSALVELEDNRFTNSCPIALYKAHLLLTIGNIPQTLMTLDHLGTLSCNPTLKAQALALQSLVQLAINKREAAKASAHTAKTLDSKCALAHYGLAMVAQAEFDLETAFDELVAMLELDPSSVLGISRLAELALARDDIELAENLLNQIKSGTAISETIRGYVHLLKRKYPQARSSFTKALNLDSELALTHFGLGLLEFTAGNEETGIRQFKTAIALEPQTATYRSYLGKALFETEQEMASLSEFANAIQIDPRDPTPFVYRSFTKLSQNEPIAALRDLQTAIELNDNRGVYRSRFLLDKDLGTRSAGLARVYSDLGFKRVSRLQAIHSISEDYRNFSAHRLLAESSAALFDADAALSERRIADLLAPLSFNLFNSTGESATLNDYNALFDKSEQRTLGAYTYDERSDQHLGVSTVTGKTENMGYLASVAGVVGDGSKDNNYSRDYRTLAAVQYQPNYKTRLVADTNYSHRRLSDRGRETEAVDQYKFGTNLGLNHEFSRSSLFLAQFGLSRQSLELTGVNTNRPLETTITAFDESTSFTTSTISRDATELDQDSGRGEIQFVYDSDYYTSVVGALSIGSRYSQSEASPILDDEFTIYSDIGRQYQTRSNDPAVSHDLYWYNNLEPWNWLTLSAGATGSYVRTAGRSVTPYLDSPITSSRLNPKLGAVLRPYGSFSLRSAWFESLRKAAEDNQSTLEPVLVGGIVQRFNDLPGSYSRNLASGLDWHHGTRIFVGVETLTRHLIDKEVAAVDALSLNYNTLNTVQTTVPTGVVNFHQNQRFYRGYLYGILNDRIAATADYFQSDIEFADPSIDSSTTSHSTEAALRYFSPLGWFSTVKESWIQQTRANDLRFSNGTEDFWLTDLTLGYRIPKRQGTFAFELLNLFDKNFSYNQDLQFEQIVRPTRSVRLSLSYNF